MKNIRALSIEFTNYCNYKCILCPHSFYKKKVSPAGNIFDREKGFISQELCELSLREAAYCTENVLIGFFGEPLLHPRFHELMLCIPRTKKYEVHCVLSVSVHE